ncbi:MAG: protein kinase [Chloroflexaceae bacterium]|jgi:serine/threonine-protein kinase|nr:protein kinase [Chloroflexaceae bacterium]
MSNTQILCPVCQHPAYPGEAYCGQCGSDMALTTANRTYYLTRTIKKGGQGAVYVGTDLSGATYAIKQMLEQFENATERTDAVERFMAEGRLLQRLSHPRIPRVYDVFEDDGRCYLVMDLVRGEDLARHVERVNQVDEVTVLKWVDEICKVLTFLHSQQPPIIFRDIKPSNIMLEPEGTLKLIDFGIAKALQGTQRGTQIGTPGYAPPEQYQGFASPASDVFALCATMHHLLTGRDPQEQPPFSFPDVRRLAPQISERTAQVIARGLKMTPEERYASIGDLTAALGIGPRRTIAAPPLTAPASTTVATNGGSSGLQPASAPVKANPAPKQTVSAAVQTSPPSPMQTAPRTAQPPTPAANPGQPTVAPAPASPAASPAASPTPAASPVSGSGMARAVGCIVGVLVLVLLLLGGGAVALGFIALPSDPTDVTPAPATPLTLVRQQYRLENLEIITPASDAAGVQLAFETAYRQKAEAQYGSGARVEAVQVEGQVLRLGQESQGTRYRATLSGTVLVPQGP